ncbi:hypothetical protein COU91_02620 [Candidatus Saccharibacteria bacterium CG10_big_fil_rev_8_21_14_0_10_47_8]|nr:MAG: hypothetical protein COU91_02620 [Candidatus Saccharibacteria bacterium CG10_big_fil_rev_8_21_14_0_10_47_8]
MTELLARQTNSEPISAQSFSFYDKVGYFRELVRRISVTVKGDRVMLVTMSFKTSIPEVNAIMEELYTAARRGVNVTFCVDANAFLAGSHATPGPLFFSTKLPKRLPSNYRAKYEALEKLKSSGGHYAIINRPSRPFSRPFAGRSHIKMAIINNYIYIGGCNINDINHLDIMLGWNDKLTADFLYRFTNKIVSAQSTELIMHGRDLTYILDPNTVIMMDSGKQRQSLIFERAMELIDEAQESVMIACQYFPNSVTAKHLIKAHKRGVKVTIIYNHPSKHGILHSALQHLVVLRERSRTPPALFKEQLPKSTPFLHAKLVATEKAAIIGSHNYVTAGVNFGTAEIALLRHDAEFARQAVSALKMQT